MSPKKRDEDEAKSLAPAQQGGGILAPAPAFLAGETSMAGMEKMRQQDVTFPRLRLMQPLSPEVAEGKAVAGDYYNDLTKQVVMHKDEEVDFIPEYFWPSWIEWHPRDAGGGVIEASNDERSRLAQRCERGEKWPDGSPHNMAGKRKVTEYLNFIVLLPDVPDHEGKASVAVISFYRTGHYAGKYLLSLARLRKKPLFAGKYCLKVKYVENGAKKYFVPKVENSDTDAGWATKEQFDFAKAQYDAHVALANRIKPEDVGGPEAAPEAGGDDGKSDDSDIQ